MLVIEEITFRGIDFSLEHVIFALMNFFVPSEVTEMYV